MRRNWRRLKIDHRAVGAHGDELQPRTEGANCETPRTSWVLCEYGESITHEEVESMRVKVLSRKVSFSLLCFKGPTPLHPVDGQSAAKTFSASFARHCQAQQVVARVAACTNILPGSVREGLVEA